MSFDNDKAAKRVRDMLDPHNVMQINASPLQMPGRDKLLRTSTLCGPELAGDRRLYLSVQMLAELLEVARSSPMSRVRVNRVGVRVDLHVDNSGHEYENWTLIGANPRPERMPNGITEFVQRTKAT